MTRPEGALFSIIGFLILTCQEKGVRAKGFFIAILLIAAGYFIWRCQYFGHIFPNPFYIKSGHEFSIRKVIVYLIGNIQYFIVALTLLLLVKNTSFRILLSTIIGLNLFFYGKSDLQMNYVERFPFQTFFPLFLASFFIVKNRVNTVMVFILTGFLLGSIYAQKTAMLHLATYYPKGIQSHAKLGIALSEFKDKNLSLMVGDAGMIPYFSEWQSYDSIGLANDYVGQNGFSREYIERVSPDLILMYSRTSDIEGIRINDHNQQYIYPYITESQQYSLAGASRWQDDYYILSFLKKSILDFKKVQQSIRNIDTSTRNFKVSIKDFVLQEYLIFPKK